MACIRFSPSMAEQPLPGFRLLHGVQVSSRKYGQRVRCIKFPPIDAALRSCGDALARSACAMAGAYSRTSACSATSLMRASAPMRMPPLSREISPIGRALMSTTCAGRSTSHFIRSTRFVPPAMNFADSRPPETIACETSVARAKSNGCIAASVLRFTNGGDDSGVCAAAADVATHPLANFVFAGRVSFLQQRDTRANLSGRAVSALESVVSNERGLQRMQLSIRGNALDGRDALTAVHDGERQAGVVAASVDQHGARAARSLIASLLRAGEIEMFAQRIEKCRARIDLQRM